MTDIIIGKNENGGIDYIPALEDITEAILKAARDAEQQFDRAYARELAKQVIVRWEEGDGGRSSEIFKESSHRNGIALFIEAVLLDNDYRSVAEAYASAIGKSGMDDEIELSDNALIVLRKRYLRKDKEGNPIEFPSTMFRRVAKDVASADKLYGSSEEEVQQSVDSFYRVMTSLEFLPNSPTLRGAGRILQQLSGCFVIPVGDSLEEIFDAIKWAALIHKTGGGVGYSFSKLRPRGDVVGSTGNVAGGPISFMRVFSSTAQEITQGGVRMGANMGILSVTHPDIMDFITCKNDNQAMVNFNISVAVTDDFMRAVDKDEDWGLINPRTDLLVKKMKAKEIWGAIIKNAWKNGDPGVIFIDRINKYNPTPHLGAIESTNPCVSGDTRIAVADGRKAVPIKIKKLAELGEDTPVYCWSRQDGNIRIRMARNFRLTRKKAKVYKVNLDDGGYIIVTGDHKFLTPKGDEIITLELKPNTELMAFRDGISHFTKPKAMIVESIEEIEECDVFNTTVDDFHTIAYITKLDKHNFSGVITKNCGEQPLLPYESCNLGSINLSRMITAGQIDWEKLRETVRIAVHFLDNVIDRNKYALPKIEEMTKGNRKIGLGVMGWADMLIQLGIPYDSEEALSLAEKAMEFISSEATKRSSELADKRGVFLNFKGSIYDVPEGMKMRNAARTTIAPTGTIGIIAGCSGGIEPLFSIAYVRETLFNKGGSTEKLLVVNKWFEKIAKERGFYSKALMEKIAEVGSVQGIEEVPEDVKEVFKTAHDISPEYHVRMQAAFQMHVDNAVSKTVNLRHKATEEDVEKVFWLAYETGCKGITIYRDGSRDFQVLNVGTKDATKEEPKVRVPRARPAVTRGTTQVIRTGCGKLYITINEDEEGLCEVFARMGKTGGCLAAQSEGIGRLISLALRSGVETKAIIKQLKGIRCPSPLWREGGAILSCPDAIGKALERYIKDGNASSEEEKKEVFRYASGMCPECPECGHMVEFVEGCVICRACGYSRCG